MRNKEKPFDESTKLKLDIFGECFREWLPVFLNTRTIQQVFVFDFFAGSGTDINGVKGSPLILLEEAKGEDRNYCSKLDKKFEFIFTEKNMANYRELNRNVDNFVMKCINKNQCENCVYEIKVKQNEFGSAFSDSETQKIFANRKIGKFVLLDQYGFKEIDENVFLQLVNSPKTDFIFFISSSYIKRFKDHPTTKLYIDTTKMKFEESQPKECHRIIAK